MSNLTFSNKKLTFDSNYDAHYLQARTTSKIANNQMIGSSYIYSQIVTLYTVERDLYVLRDLDTNLLYGFGILESSDIDYDLVFGEVEDLEYQDYIWIDDFSTGVRIPYQYLLYVQSGKVYFFKPDNNLIYPDRFKRCYALADSNGTLYRIVVIENDLYLIPESELNLSGGE